MPEVVWLVIGYLVGFLTVVCALLLRRRPHTERAERNPYVHPANIDRERVNREYAAFNRHP